MVDECFFRSGVDGVAGEADQTVVGAVELQINAILTEASLSKIAYMLPKKKRVPFIGNTAMSNLAIQ